MHIRPVLRELRYWPAIVRQTFKGDVCLLRQYHVAAPCHLDMAVADTYAALKTTAPDFQLYGLYATMSVVPVGMIGIEPGNNCLVTFGLGFPFRSPAMLGELSALIRNLLDPSRPAICRLYQRNTPAQRFLKRMGFVASPDLLTHPVNGQTGILFTLPPTP